MGVLSHGKREALAQQLAIGLSPTLASQAAQYVDNAGARLKKRVERSDVTARVAEIKWEKAARTADLTSVINGLMAAAIVAGRLNTAAAFTAVRGLFAEAARLKLLATPLPFLPGSPLDIEMTEEEWLAAFCPDAEPLAKAAE